MLIKKIPPQMMHPFVITEHKHIIVITICYEICFTYKWPILGYNLLSHTRYNQIAGVSLVLSLRQCHVVCSLTDGLPNDPLMCTLMRHYKRVTDDDGCSTKDVERMFSCEGGCGKVTGYCCEPTEFSYTRMLFTCPAGGVKFAEVWRIT